MRTCRSTTPPTRPSPPCSGSWTWQPGSSERVPPFFQIFLTGVVVLNAGVIGLTYCLGLPYWWSRNRVACVILIALGHWILANVVFHLYKAATTPPGYPPVGQKLPECVSICKKCIAPKPPRAHHCSVCNRCVLKMDHHCPWLNNCIGHANRRHFFSYMVHVCVGLLYVLVFGWNIIWAILLMPLDEAAGDGAGPAGADARLADFDDDGDGGAVIDPHLAHIPTSIRLRSVIVFYGFCCGGSMLMLGGLAFWHGKLISRGETSIEAHINKSEAKRLSSVGKEFRNPYDFGWRENWKEFLGFRDWRSFCRRVLLPSAHLPPGDGLSWPTVYNSATTTTATDGGERRISNPAGVGGGRAVRRRAGCDDPTESLLRFHSEFELVKTNKRQL